MPWRVAPGGVRLVVRVTPRAAADRIDGIETRDDGGTVLRVRVTAVPDQGRANTAVIALLAGALDVPRSDITLAAGATARIKTLAIAGDPDALATSLAGLATPQTPG